MPVPCGAPTDMPAPASSLVGRDMLCFSHDWTGDPLSKTHLMRLLARQNRVLWVNSVGYRAPNISRTDAVRILQKLQAATTPIREVEPNLFVLSPLAVPAWGRSGIRKLNAYLLRIQIRRAMKKLRFRRPINWVFNPAAGVVAGTLGESSIFYYCVDEYTAFAGVPTEALSTVEKALMARADAVFVSAQRLYKNKSHANARTYLIRHGVDYDHFRQALDPATVVPPDIASLPRPVIGYFGLLSDDWVDVPLLVHVAKAFPAASIVMLGKVVADLSALRSLPNVHLLGRKAYQSLPAYCKGFDLGIIPFPISEVTLNANPLKAREYLAAGLPVVSTAIPEVEVLRLCGIGRSKGEFVERIRDALAAPGPDASRSEQMATESWAARLREISACLNRDTTVEAVPESLRAIAP